jgi:hypothetical protein
VGWSRRFALALDDDDDGGGPGDENNEGEDVEAEADDDGEDDVAEVEEDGGDAGSLGRSGRTLRVGWAALLVPVFHPADRDRDLVLPLLVKLLPPGPIASGQPSGAGASVGNGSSPEGNESTTPFAFTARANPASAAPGASRTLRFAARGPATFAASHTHDPLAASGRGGSGSGSKSVAAVVWGAAGGAPAVLEVSARLSVVAPLTGALGLRLDLLLAEDDDVGLGRPSTVGLRPLWIEVPPAMAAQPLPAAEAAADTADAPAATAAAAWSRCLLGVAAVDADVGLESPSDTGLDDSTHGSSSSSSSGGGRGTASGGQKGLRAAAGAGPGRGRLGWLLGGWQCAAGERKDRGKRYGPR